MRWQGPSLQVRLRNDDFRRQTVQAQRFSGQASVLDQTTNERGQLGPEY